MPPTTKSPQQLLIAREVCADFLNEVIEVFSFPIELNIEIKNKKQTNKQSEFSRSRGTGTLLTCHAR